MAKIVHLKKQRLRAKIKLTPECVNACMCVQLRYTNTHFLSLSLFHSIGLFVCFKQVFVAYIFVYICKKKISARALHL